MKGLYQILWSNRNGRELETLSRLSFSFIIHEGVIEGNISVVTGKMVSIHHGAATVSGE